MNILQNYMTMEMLLSFLVVGALTLMYVSFRLSGRLHNTNEKEDDSFVEDAPFLTRPNSGQVWYTRTGQWQPFINKEVEPVKILQYRVNEFDQWVQYEQGDNVKIESMNDFFAAYMPDEFSDIVTTPVKEEVHFEEDVDYTIEFDEEATVPSKNIVNIDGRNYILAPV
jgi:hypothetical protein